jgi:hypothetical protein
VGFFQYLGNSDHFVVPLELLPAGSQGLTAGVVELASVSSIVDEVNFPLYGDMCYPKADADLWLVFNLSATVVTET